MPLVFSEPFRNRIDEDEVDYPLMSDVDVLFPSRAELERICSEFDAPVPVTLCEKCGSVFVWEVAPGEYVSSCGCDN